jgi:hypothetical protein
MAAKRAKPKNMRARRNIPENYAGTMFAVTNKEAWI